MTKEQKMQDAFYLKKLPKDWTASALLKSNWLTLLLSTAAIVASLLPGVAEALQFDRVAIAQGQLWRAVTGNFVHWNVDHLLWDALMFGILGAVLEWRSRSIFAMAVALSAVAVSATTCFVTPQETYRGLSGIDSALFVLLAAWYLIDSQTSRIDLPPLIPAVLLTGFVGKIGYEIATGHTYFVNSVAAGFTPLPQVHLAGAAAGILVLSIVLHR